MTPALTSAASAASASSTGVRFFVINNAKEKGIVNPVVCIIRNIRVGKESSKVYDPMIADLEKRVGEIRLNVLPTDEVQGYRKLYEGIGSKVTPAGENFLKGFDRRAFPRYNNIVDAYNTLTLETVTPYGMHDAAKLIENGTLIFRRAEGTEKLVPSFETKEQTIPKGDFTYGIRTASGFSPFAWLGKKDKDNSEYQVKDTTTSLLFTAIGNHLTTQERNVYLCEEVFKRIRLSCPDAECDIVKPTFVDTMDQIPESSK